MSSRAGGVIGGLLALVLGGVLVFRPFASLAVLVLLVGVGLVALGVLHLREGPTGLALAVALGYAVLGGVVLLWPGLGVAGVALLVGAGLVVAGLLRLAGAFRGAGEERLAAVLGGAADVLLGVLALAWPDVTLVVVAVLFGLKLLWVGLTSLWRGIRGDRPSQPDAPPGRLARLGHVLGSAAALLVAVVLALLSTRLHAGQPVPDAFYTPPDDLPAEAGQLLRVEDFDRGLPDGAEGWRILYTTTRDEGEPAVASALVVTDGTASDEPRPVVAWAHGTTGAAEGCAPSILDDPLGSGAAPAVDQVLASGWTLVATDYVGLGTEGPHPYLIGEGEGRSVLDAVRAAQQMDETETAGETVVWGHSQGGHAALWAGQLASSYAPDLDVLGVAALAPASDLRGLVGNLDVVPGGAIFASYVLKAYSEVYDDVDLSDYVRATARIPVREMAERCLAEPEVFVSIVESLVFDRSIFARPPTEGSLGERLAQNTPDDPIPFPLLIGQGEADPLVLPDAQRAYAERRCEMAGGPVDYRSYRGFDHVGVVADDSPLVPELLRWTQDRFDGKRARSTCG